MTFVVFLRLEALTVGFPQRKMNISATMPIKQKEEIMNSRISIDIEQIRAFCAKWHITSFALFGSVLREDFDRIAILTCWSPLPRMHTLRCSRFHAWRVNSVRFSDGRLIWSIAVGLRRVITHFAVRKY